MSPLSLVHVLVALVAVILGSTIFALRKGDRRHRRLGWIYAACMTASLAAILIRGGRHPSPFHGYAVLVLASIAAAIFASRRRAWHGALMSFSMLAAIVAIGGVAGGLILGVGKGPAYYRMFNVVIVAITLLGLAIINTRPVIWRGADLRIRAWFTAIVVIATAALVVAQFRI